MGSFFAQLQVGGQAFPVVHCTFEVQQGTQQRGRVSTNVRYGPVQLVLDMPAGDVLPAWAADPHKRQATAIVFLDAASGRALETLYLPAAYCVLYGEQFQAGDDTTGAYGCQLTLADPDGWTLLPAGPTAVVFAAPAGSRVQPGLLATSLARA